jgi:hypothetical protein
VNLRSGTTLSRPEPGGSGRTIRPLDARTLPQRSNAIERLPQNGRPRIFSRWRFTLYRINYSITEGCIAAHRNRRPKFGLASEMSAKERRTNWENRVQNAGSSRDSIGVGRNRRFDISCCTRFQKVCHKNSLKIEAVRYFSLDDCHLRTPARWALSNNFLTTKQRKVSRVNWEIL